MLPTFDARQRAPHRRETSSSGRRQGALIKWVHFEWNPHTHENLNASCFIMLNDAI